MTPFRRLWYSTALSSLGDWLGLLATTALATNLAHGYKAQNYALGGVLVVKLLPAIVLGPLAGAFADRFDRRLTMVISDFVRFVLFLTIPLAHLVVDTRQTLVWLLVASFLIECVSLFWMPAKDASVPNLVRRDQIEAANQLSLITTYGLTPVLGRRPVLGAVADHQRAGAAPALLPHATGQPRALLQRRDVPGRRDRRVLHPRDQRPPRRGRPRTQPSLLSCCARAPASSGTRAWSAG